MHILDNPRVSVVIPTWNRAKLIAGAIDSALNQTLQPIEILICDDGSTDETFQVVNSFTSKDSRVKWIAGKRSGSAAAPRNRGVTQAKGDWIAFLDSDDAWHKDKLKLQFSEMKKFYPSSLASCTNAIKIYDDKKDYDLFFLPMINRQFNIVPLMENNCVITSSVLIHRSIIDLSYGFPEEPNLKVGEDYALWLQIATLTKFSYLGAPLVIYLDSPKSSIRQGKRSEIYVIFNVFKSYIKWLYNYQWQAIPWLLIIIAFVKLKLFLKRLYYKSFEILSWFKASFPLAFPPFLENQPRYSNAGQFPLVSIVMPVYNSEKYLSAAIDSILGQTFVNFELIIVDDGSTDSSVAILESYTDTRIIFRRMGKNQGLVSALNYGISLARASFIARMDADDLSRPDRIRLQYEFLLANQEVGLVGTNISLFGEFIKTRVHRYPSSSKLISNLLAFENCIAHPSVMFRKSVFDKLGGYSNQWPHVEDWALWLKFQRVTKISNIDVVLLDYRVHNSSVSRVNTILQNQSIRSLLIDNLNQLGFTEIDDIFLVKNECTHTTIYKVRLALLTIMNQNETLNIFCNKSLAEILQKLYLEFLFTAKYDVIRCFVFFYENPITTKKISTTSLLKVLCKLILQSIKRGLRENFNLR